MQLVFSRDKINYYLIFACSLLIFFQQVCVINVGGSFKIYEFIALIISFNYLLSGDIRIYSNDSAILFLFFICVVTVSYIFSLFNVEKFEYYQRFPEAKEILRANIFFSTTTLLIYYYFNWMVYNVIVGSKHVFVNKDRIIKVFVWAGTCISIYNLYSYFLGFKFGFPDLVPFFLDQRNSTAFLIGRVSGFSDEPGSYIFLQGWVILYLFFYKYKDDYQFNFFIKLVNIISVLLTFSSALIALFGVIFLGVFIKQNGLAKIKTIFIVSILFTLLIQVVLFYNLEDIFRYVLIDKISNLFSTPTHTFDSGSFRSYTARLGFEVFKDYPILGVGGGASCFFLWRNEFNMGIISFGEKIGYMTYPQNIYSKVLAEFGIIGFTLFISYFTILVLNVVKMLRVDSSYLVGFLGVLFTMSIFASIYPETSLFLWFNLALLSNEVKFKKRGIFKQ